MITAGDLVAGAKRERATLDSPVDHLYACHRRIEQRLDTLERAGQHIEDRPAEAREAIVNSVRFFRGNGVWHTQDEEQSVFPRLAGKLTEEESAFVAGLEAEHAAADVLLERLYAAAEAIDRAGAPDPSLTQEYREAAAAVSAAYRAHIATEDGHLLALAAAKLDASELAAISAEMKSRRGL